MNLSFRQLIAPWIGALVAWCGSHGFKLTPEQTLILTALACGAFANGVHWLEAHLEGSPVRVRAPDASTSRTLPKLLLLPFLLIAAAGVLSACASSPVRSTDEGLYAAYGTYAAVEQALAQGLATHSISRAQGEELQTQALEARALLDAARAAEQSAPSSSSSDLTAAVAALAALQAALNNPGASPPGAKP